MSENKNDELLDKIQELIYDVKMLVGFVILDFVILTLLFLMVFGFMVIAF